MINHSIIPGAVVFLKSSPDCKMTVGYCYGNGFFDCTWIAANKELQVQKFHHSMLTLSGANAPEIRVLGFRQGPERTEQQEFYAKKELTWL